MNVKFLRRLKLTEGPAMSYYEGKIYSQLLPDGKAYRFHFLQEVKSFITHPSFGLKMNGPGYYEISGIAYSGNGRISRVMVSADGGKTWRRRRSRSGVLQGFCPLPRALALEWRSRGPAKSRLGRSRQHATDSRRVRGRAGRDQEAGYESSRVPQPALQQHHELGIGSDGRSNMSTLKLVLAFVLALVVGSGAALAQTPRLGKPISEADIKAWDIAVMPDGTGLPPGSGTAAQGARVFAEKCSACHGEGGKGSPLAPAPLFGGAPLTSGIETPKTIGNFFGYSTIVFDFVRRAMPSVSRGR